MQITNMPQVLSAEHSAITKQTLGIKRCAHHERKHAAGTNLTNTRLITSVLRVLSAERAESSRAAVGTECHGLLQTPNVAWALGMLHTSNPAQAPCVCSKAPARHGHCEYQANPRSSLCALLSAGPTAGHRALSVLQTPKRGRAPTLTTQSHAGCGTSPLPTPASMPAAGTVCSANPKPQALGTLHAANTPQVPSSDLGLGGQPQGSSTHGCSGPCPSLREREPCSRAAAAARAGVLRACYFIFTCPIPLAQLSATREGKIDAKRDINLSWSVSPAARLCQPSSRDALQQPSSTCN